MKKHPTEVPLYEGELALLAHHVNAMRYDQVVAFYVQAAKELRQQAAGDRERGRMRLATKLEMVAVKLDVVIMEMKEVWRICKPHMKEEMEG